MVTIHRCLCHDRLYTRCQTCTHQYCATYWTGCPRCGFARRLDTTSDRAPVYQLPGDRASWPDALAVARETCAGCGEPWPCSDRGRTDISGRERAKHHL
jgi:hypothetical protein